MIGLSGLKTRVMANKQRTGALLCVLLVLSGFFMPFMSARADVSVSGIMNNTVTVISPEYDMINFSLSDFVWQEPIDEFAIYVPWKYQNNGSVGAGNAKKPAAGSGLAASSVNDALSSPALDYLVDPKVQEIVAARLSNGANVNTILMTYGQ